MYEGRMEGARSGSERKVERENDRMGHIKKESRIDTEDVSNNQKIKLQNKARNGYTAQS